MIEDRLKKTAIYTAAFSMISLGIIFYRAGTKNIMIAEATNEQATSEDTAASSQMTIAAPNGDKGKGNLVIPLEVGVGSEDITFEEKHAEHQFLLFINGESPDFYENNQVISDLELIKGATCVRINDHGGVCLVFDLDGLYENETALGDREITVTFKTPGDVYENVVVIDPIDDIGVSLVPYIKKQLEGEENIKVYFTRQSESEADDATSQVLIDEAAADFYLQLGAEKTREDDSSGIITYYNGRFFIRSFGNVEFADQMEKYVASSAGATAIGLAEVNRDDEKLMTSGIPSAFVSIGNKNNKNDNEKLSQEAYLEKCAAGVVDGIRASFGIVNPEEPEETTDALQGIINGN